MKCSNVKTYSRDVKSSCFDTWCYPLYVEFHFISKQRKNRNRKPYRCDEIYRNINFIINIRNWMIRDVDYAPPKWPFIHLFYHLHAGAVSKWPNPFRDISEHKSIFLTLSRNKQDLVRCEHRHRQWTVDDGPITARFVISGRGACTAMLFLFCPCPTTTAMASFRLKPAGSRVRFFPAAFSAALSLHMIQFVFFGFSYSINRSIHESARIHMGRTMHVRSRDFSFCRGPTALFWRI